MHVARFLSLGLSLALTPAAVAQIWTEAGDAGKLPGSAQVIAAGTGALTRINGNFNDPTEALGAGNDKDMYLINISSPTTFSATTVGGSTDDTQLFLLKADGRGVAHNDDSAATAQSTLTSLFTSTLPAGNYYLCVTTYNRDPVSGGGLIWNNTPFSTERAPDGPGAASPISGWQGESAFAPTPAAYSIFLTGCSYVTPVAFEIYPGATSFTSRGTATSPLGLACEVTMGFHDTHWGSIGDSGPSSSVIGFTYITQDQNAATTELYDVVVRSGTSAAGPDPTVAGELTSINGLATPTGVGIVAWQVTADFATPVAIPEKGFFAAGLRFAANPGWPTTDGQSLHGTNTATQQSGPHQEDHAWQIQAGVTSHPSLKRTWRMAPRVLTPTLQNGVFAVSTTNYAKGMGGMFPPIATHGWSTHISAGASYAGGFAALFASGGKLASSIAFAGFGGNLCIDPATLLPLPLLPLSATGTADVPILPVVNGPIGPATVYLQAVVVSPAFALHFTNMNATTFQ